MSCEFSTASPIGRGGGSVAALAGKFKHLKGLKCHYTFRIGAEIGEGGQSGGEEETRRRRRWVETRLAEVATLDCLGSELEEETLEAHGLRLPATEKIAFDHNFEPAKQAPPESR
jgi:hypothetical protein